MSAAVKRACDACHRRKVKCDGINPCRNCSSAQLACTYNAIPQKKGPKGSRAKVISELRENQRQSSLSAKIHNRMNSITSPISALAPTPGLLTNDMVKACIEFFFANMYTTIPILDRMRIEQDAMSMDTTLDTYCLLCSLCAFMMLQPGMPTPTSDPYGPESIPGASIITATLLLEETNRVRKGYEYMQSPTFYTLATNYFLFACHYGLDLHDKAWCSLREATTLVHLVRMNKEDTYHTWDQVDATRRRRLYWLLYSAERAYALQHDRPMSLKPTVNPPAPADDPSDPYASQLVGFCRLMSLFRAFDSSFVDLWNRTRSDCSPTLVAALQKQQNGVIGALASADPQLCDVTRSQQWLQNLTWQISLAKGNTTGSAGNDMAAYLMMDVTREMVPMAASFSNQGSSELLNSGLIESLLTITNDLMDVLSMMPSSGNPFTVSPRDHLHQLASFLAMLRIGEHRFTPLLLVKAHEVLPRLVNPMLQSAPETACEIDIFDGFGTAGMVPQPYLPIDEYKTEASSSAGGASSMQDVASPFTSSPPILSPGLDFSHSMNGDYAPITEIVMHQSVAGGISSLSPVSGMPSSQQQIQSQLHQAQAPMHQLSHQSQQQQKQSPMMQHSQQSHQLPHHLPQQQHPGHHQHQPQEPQPIQNQQLQQQQQLPQHMPQQHFQQHLQQQRTQHQPLTMLRGLKQNLRNDVSMQQRTTDGLTPPNNMDMGGQAIDQTQNITDQGMTNVLRNQGFVGSVSGVNDGLNANNSAIRPQPHRSSSFAIAAQQIRTVGDFHALQRANSDTNTLSSMSLNNLGADLDFIALG